MLHHASPLHPRLPTPPPDLDLSSRSEVALDSQVFWWHDKYKPRKPKYFNRVHTGFEWSKYNRVSECVLGASGASTTG